MLTQRITIINRSTVLRDQDVQAVLPALQTQITRDFAPIWGVDALLTMSATTLPFSWPMVLWDNADVAGAAGYHEDPGGQPDGKVFVKTTIDAGLNWTVTLSHELLELPADPSCRRTRRYGIYRYALEVADAVEDDRYGYQIDGVQVSDFITPAWYGGSKPGGVYDFCRHLTAPRRLLPNGYVVRWDPLHGWQQIVAQQGVVQARKGLSTLYVRPGTSGRTVKRLYR